MMTYRHSSFWIKSLLLLAVLGSLGLYFVVSGSGTWLSFSERSSKEGPQEVTFRIQIPRIPESLSLSNLRGSSGHYLIHQLTCPLLIWDENEGLLPHAASACEQKNPTLYVCRVRPELTWSSGRPLTAQDFEQAWKERIDPAHPFFRKDLLLPIKNAQAIMSRQVSPKDLGVTALNPQELEIQLEQAQGDFLYYLSNPLLSPEPSQEDSCGPFDILSWSTEKVVLQKKVSWLPDSSTTDLSAETNLSWRIEFLAYPDENLALKAYEEGHIDFLYRLPSGLKSRYAQREDFVEKHLLRLDGLFARPGSSVEKLLPYFLFALDHEEWKTLYESDEPTGCLGLPPSWTDSERICIQNLLTRPNQPLPQPSGKISLYYSKLGGSDHDRAMLYVSEQLSNKLGIQVIADPMDNKALLSRWEAGQLDFIRKGVTLERASPQAALEGLLLLWQPNEPALTVVLPTSWWQIYDQFRSLDPQSAQTKAMFKQLLKDLLKARPYIPTGRIEFRFLARPQWSGWRLNNLNHLYLLNLHNRS